MLKLGQSSIFKRDYETFKNKIEKIENVELRKELTQLLTELLNEVKNIDHLHGDLAVNNRLSMGTTDVRSNLTSIRRQLIKKLNDWDEFLQQTNQV